MAQIVLSQVGPVAGQALLPQGLPVLAQTLTGAAIGRFVGGFSVPLVISESSARELASSLLSASLAADTASLSTGPELGVWEAGDRLELPDGSVWMIGDVVERDLIKTFSLVPEHGVAQRERSSTPTKGDSVVSLAAAPEIVLIDGPKLPGRDAGLIVAATADPWPGSVVLMAGSAPDTLVERHVIDAPAIIGSVRGNASSGPVGRWDEAASLDVDMP